MRRMSRLRRLGTWYSEADLHRLTLLADNGVDGFNFVKTIVTTTIVQASTAEEAFNQKEISPLSR